MTHSVEENSGVSTNPAVSIGARGWWLCALAALLATLVYFNALHNPFVYDDHRTVENNGSIVSLRNWRAVLLHELTRPVVNLSYAIDRRIWGPAPFGFHLTSVLLHALNVVLLFHLVWRLVLDDRVRRGQTARGGSIDARVAAGAAALLFAVHPMMTEAVGYISGRSEVLCASFILLAMLSARRWMLMPPGRASVGFWWITVVCWTLALATKETAAVLPFLLLACNALVLSGDQNDRRRRRRRLLVPLVAATLVAALARLFVFTRVEHGGLVTLEWRSIFDELDVVRRYIGLLIAPSGQAIFHEVHPIASLLAWPVLTGVATVGSLIALAFWMRRRAPLGTFGIFWFLMCLAPSSALVVLDQGEGMVEHRVYLASCGLFLAVGAGAGWIAVKLEAAGALRWLVLAAAAAGVLSLSGRTVLRNAIWASPVMVWQEAVDQSPDSWLPLTVLGESLHAAGQHAQAVAAYSAAIRLRPSEELGYIKIAMCLSELGEVGQAKVEIEALRRIDPHSTSVPIGLGIVALASGDTEEARREFAAALVLNPRDPMALQWMSVIVEEIDGDPAEALRLCQQIDAIVPGDLGNEECMRRNQALLQNMKHIKK